MLILKSAVFLGILSLFLIACTNSETGSKEGKQEEGRAQKPAPDSSKYSITMEAGKWIHNTQITIKYHSPAVRDRIIWGGLVPYGQVWVTGAHKATTLEVSKDFVVGEKKIPAGKYSVFTIPGKEEWIVIINKNWDQHLADEYSEAEDVVRITVKPETLPTNVERLNYEIDQTGERMADILISWEKVRIPFRIRID